MAQKVTSDEDIYLTAAASNGNATDTSGDYFETSESEFESLLNCQPVKRNEALAAYARERILSNSNELNRNLSFMTSSSDDEEDDTDSYDEQNNISVLPMNFDESLPPCLDDPDLTNPADETPKQVPVQQISYREQKSIINATRTKHDLLNSLKESKTVFVTKINAAASDANDTEVEELFDVQEDEPLNSTITSDVDYSDQEEELKSPVVVPQQHTQSIAASGKKKYETNSYVEERSVSTHSGTVSPKANEKLKYESDDVTAYDRSEMNRKSREKLMKFKLNLLKWKERQNFANTCSLEKEETVEQNIQEDAPESEYSYADNVEYDKESYYVEEEDYETDSCILTENEAELSEYSSYTTDTTDSVAEYTSSATEADWTQDTDAEVTEDSPPHTCYARNDFVEKRIRRTRVSAAKPSESEQLKNLEKTAKTQMDLKGKNLSKAKVPVPARFPAVKPFKNRSFTDLQMREIERENSILARKLVALKPKKINNPYNKVVQRTIIAPSLTTRKKQQQQIDFENNILRGKLMAIGRRKPLF